MRWSANLDLRFGRPWRREVAMGRKEREGYEVEGGIISEMATDAIGGGL